MAYQILATKLYGPPLQRRFVARAALLERLDLGVRQGRRLTLVSAPAGFGKSTLVSQWLLGIENREWRIEKADQATDHSLFSILHSPFKTAWLSLDTGDNDPVRFLVYLVAALQKADPSLGQQALAALQSPQVPPLPELVAALLNELAAAAGPLVLVLDDYHLIKQREVHALTQLLLERQPATLHTVIITREDPPLPLPRMRVHGQLTEVRERELRFSQREAACFFHDTMGLDLAEAAVSALERQTEGWVAGLQLAAIALQEYGDAQHMQTFIATFAGNDRYVADYLLSEVLARQPESVQRFLLQTSILERMCAPLCDALFTAEGAGLKADASEPQPSALSPQPSSLILEQLERANMFLIPLDNRRQWYRYHHLFGELLHHTLLHTSGMAPARLHRRASTWYEQHGFLPEAVAHACKAEDWTFAAELVERHAMDLINQTQVVLLQEWIEGIPETAIRARPGLAIFHAWVLMLSFRADVRPLVREKLVQAEQALHAQEHPPLLAVGQGGALVPPGPWVSGQIAAIRSQLLLASFTEPVDPHQVISLSERSLELLPEGEQTVRSICAMSVAHGYLMLGDIANIKRAFLEARELALKADIYLSIANTHFYLARVAYLTGELDRASALCDEGLATLRPRFANPEQEFPAIRSLYVMQAVILLERGELAEAQRLLELATNRVGYAPWVELIAYEALVRLWELRGDGANVLTALERMAPMGTQLAACGEALRVRYLLSREPATAPVRAAATAWTESHAPDLAASLVVNGIGPYQVDAEYILLKGWLWVQLALGNPRIVLEHAAPILAAAEEKGFVQRVIELALLKAVALRNLGDEPGALAALAHALATAEPGGQIAAFHQGLQLSRLLMEAWQQDMANTHLAHVLDALGLLPAARAVSVGVPGPGVARAGAENKPAGLVEPLSDRELEVLALLAQGLTLGEVAEQLYLSPHTVKAHTQHIYAKLEAHGRIEAVNRARALGLIG